jgi:hypothetical protein
LAQGDHHGLLHVGDVPLHQIFRFSGLAAQDRIENIVMKLIARSHFVQAEDHDIAC